MPIEIILMDDNGSRKKAHNDTRYVSLDHQSQYLFNGIFAAISSQLDYLLDEACIYPSNLLLLLFTLWFLSLEMLGEPVGSNFKNCRHHKQYLAE